MAGENGVFIPIIIDVEGAFEDAAQRVDKAIEPLMAKMSKHALNLKFNIDENSKRSVKTLLTDSALSAEQLEKALASIRDRIMEMKAKGGFNMSQGLKEDERELIQVFSIVAQKYQGTGLLLKSLMDDAERFAKVNAESAREVTEYWSKIDSIINSTGNSITELSMKLKAGMEKLQITPAKLDDGSSNPAYNELLTKIKEWQKALYQYRLTLKDAVSGERERIEVLEEEEQSMRILNMQMSEWRKILENAPVGGEEFAEAARNIQALANEIADANYQFKMLSTNEGSIKRVSAEIAELNRKWAEASQDRKFNADGSLTGWAEGQVMQMKNLTEYSEKYGMSLEQIIAKRKELKAHEDALHNIGTSMSTLNQNLAAWRRELDSAQIDSPEWETAARMVALLSQKIKEAGDRVQELGLKSGSIEALNAKVQSLVNQWNQLSNRFGADGRMTSEARAIYNEFVKANKELQKEGQNMAAILQKQEALTQKLREQDRVRRRNQLVLSSEANTIDRIREKIQLLTERLGKVKIGSGQFTKIAAEIDVLNKKLAEAQGKTKELNAESTKTNTLLGNLLRKSLYLFGLHTITRFIQNIRQVTAEFELQQVALGAIIRDTEKAADLFKKIKAAAVQSPFEIKDLVSYTKQLAAYQIESDKLFDTMMKLADVSAGLGVDMGRLILAYGQVRAASVLRGQELRQFTEAGIPLVEKLAEKFSELRGEAVSTGEVFQLISERAVSFEMVAEIFDDMTEAGGMFYKMQEKQALTLAGQWANLKDSVSIMYDEMGRTGPVHDAMVSLINVAKSVTSNWKKWGAVIKGVAVSIITYRVAASASVVITNLVRKATALATAEETKRERGLRKTITAIIGKTAAEKVSTIATNLHTAAMNRASAATTRLGAAFWKLTAAMLSNPFGIIAVAAAALIGIIARLSTSTENLEDRINAASKAVEQFRKVSVETKGLIDRYEELSSKASLAADEQRELADISKTLAKLFPTAAKGIDEETKSVTLLVGKMRELNEEQRIAREKGLQAMLEQSQKELRGYEREIARYESLLASGKTPVQIGGPMSALFIRFKNSTKDAEAYYKKLTEFEDKKDQIVKSIEEIQKALAGIWGEPPDEKDNPLTKWQEKLISFKKDLKDGSHVQIFGEDQVKQFSRLSDALEDAAKEYKKYDTQVKELEPAVEKLTGKEKEEIQAQLDRAITARDLAKAILEYYGALFLLDKKTTTGYTQDPFIKQMQDRMKFMQDFKKGYDNLSKYINKSGALGQEAGNMLNRGLSLGIDPAQQKRAAEDLSKWYQDAMDEVFKQAQKKGAGNDMTAFLSKQITGNSNKAKALRDFQQLLQSLWDAKTDFDTTQMTKNFDNAFKKMKDELKQAEEMRNFFNDLLDITGDNELSANLTFGIYGGEQITGVKEAIQQQLSEAFASLSTDSKVNLSEDMKKAFDEMDFNYILSNMEAAKIPEEWQKILREMAQDARKYSGQIIKDFTKLVEKYGDTSQKIAVIEAKAAKEIKEVEDALAESMKNVKLTPKQKKALQEQAAAIIKALEGQRELDKFKAGEEYVRFFAEINTMTLEEATLARTQLRQAFIAAFQAGSISADELRRNLRAVDEQFKKLNEDSSLLMAYMTGGIDGLSKRVTDYADTIQVLSGKVSKGQPLSQSETNWMNSMIKMFGKSFGGDEMKGIENLDGLMESLGGDTAAAGEAMGAMAEGMGAAAGEAAMVIMIIEAVVQAVNDLITSTQSLIDQLNETRSEDNKIGDWFKYVSDFNKYAVKGWNDLKSGNGFAVLADIAGSIISIFNNVQRDKVKKYDKEIENQQKIVKNLERAHNRLEKAMKDSFGTDYIKNYNTALENLTATAAAYQLMADNERAKGKSADEDKAQSYEDMKYQIEEQIRDMQDELANFFSGTDVTSAAKSFAEAWVEAYKSFGNTTGAIKEKFKEMIDNMVINSLAAAIVQKQLKPIFDMIDNLSKEGEELSERDIAAIAAETEKKTELINAELTALMQNLAAAGVNMRGTGNSLTGIAKDISGASEQSINGLAAGINTQNFYMSYMPTISANVEAILAALTGEVAGTAARRAAAASTQSENVGSSFGDETFRRQMERMDQNIADLCYLIRSVRTGRGTNTNTHYIATK